MAGKPRKKKSAKGQRLLTFEEHEQALDHQAERFRNKAEILARARIESGRPGAQQGELSVRDVLSAIFHFPAPNRRPGSFFVCSYREIAGVLRLEWSETTRKRLSMLLSRAAKRGWIQPEADFEIHGGQRRNKYAILWGNLRRTYQGACGTKAGSVEQARPDDSGARGAQVSGPTSPGAGNRADSGVPPPRGAPRPPAAAVAGGATAPRDRCGGGREGGAHVTRGLDLNISNPRDHVAPPLRTQPVAGSWKARLDDAQTSLDRPADVQALYQIAVAAGWVQDSEQSRLWFFAAAHHTRTARKRRAAFTSLVKSPGKRTLLIDDDQWAGDAIQSLDHPRTEYPVPRTPEPPPDPHTETDQAKRRAQRELLAWAATKGTGR